MIYVLRNLSPRYASLTPSAEQAEPKRRHHDTYEMLSRHSPLYLALF